MTRWGFTTKSNMVGMKLSGAEPLVSRNANSAIGVALGKTRGGEGRSAVRKCTSQRETSSSGANMRYCTLVVVVAVVVCVVVAVVELSLPRAVKCTVTLSSSSKSTVIWLDKVLSRADVWSNSLEFCPI